MGRTRSNARPPISRKGLADRPVDGAASNANLDLLLDVQLEADDSFRRVPASASRCPVA